jgi:tRNA nucleotidyltransferase (CCA-adding enzyme)
MSGSVAVRRVGYPQVDPRAAGLMSHPLAIAPARLAIAEASRLATRRRAVLVVATERPWRAATPETLARARRLGLDGAPLEAVLWPASAVAAAAAEVTVRRQLTPARPFVLVVEAGAPVGVVFRDPGAPGGLPLSLARRLDRVPEPLRGLLRLAGAMGREQGVAVAVVGGLVRDLLLPPRGRPRRDVDLVVGGDALALAARLGRTLGARVVQHRAFLTATVEAPGGIRLDLATARRETYAVPGALPAVVPAALSDDLGRRDFSINAIAVRVDGARWGEVLDPLGGLEDARRRRVRTLHPLSFVEDPTRIFRAVRFAVRLRCRLEAGTRRLARAAAALDAYGALSGDRLRAELRATLAEPAPPAVLCALGRLGAFRLLLPAYRFPAGAAARVAETAAATRHLALAGDTRETLALLALTAHLAANDRERVARRLGLPPGTCEALARAAREAPALVQALGGVRDPAVAFRLLRGMPETTLAWALAGAGPAVRRLLRAHLTDWRTMRPLLRGGELAALGLGRGPAVGRLLTTLVEAQVAGRVRTRTQARAWARAVAGRLAGEAIPSHPAG